MNPSANPSAYGWLAALVMASSVATAHAEGAGLNLYNWSDFIAKGTVPRFEKESGIRVKYDVFDGDETLQAKMLTGRAGYDVVVPSASFVGKQLEAGVYQPLDKARIPNLANLDPRLMKYLAEVDRGNRYTVPWAWGTTGLGYNMTQAQKRLGNDVALDRWDILFKPEYLSKLKDCGVSLLDSPQDVFGSALIYLGKDPNSHNPADYQQAFELLRKVRPYITQFNSNGYINDLANGDICFALSWSGDVTMASRRAQEAHRSYKLKYYIPTGGSILSFQVMAIPKDAPHPEAAMRWINYILRPEVQAEISNEVFYPNANLPGKALVRADIRNDTSVFPPESVLSTLIMEKTIPADIQRLQNRLWTQLKTGR